MGIAFEPTKSGGQCGFAVGCRQPVAFIRDDGLLLCRQCKFYNSAIGHKKAEEEAATVAAAPTRVARAKGVKTGYCGCGCGERVARRFLPGHDAKLKARRRREQEKK